MNKFEWPETTACMGAVVHCCDCGSALTMKAYIIEVCQACDAPDQDKKRTKTLMDRWDNLGRELLKQHDDAALRAMQDAAEDETT